MFANAWDDGWLAGGIKGGSIGGSWGKDERVMDGVPRTTPEICTTCNSQPLTYVLAVLEPRRRSDLGAGLGGLSHGQACQDDGRGREVHIGRLKMRLDGKYENE